MWMMSYLFAKNGEFRLSNFAFILDLSPTSGIRVYYLPPYSPDLNPIEEAFSYVKSVLRRNGDSFRRAVNGKNRHAVFYELHCALASITPQKAQGWMGHSGYLCTEI